MPESEGPHPACSMGPVIDGPLQAFQPSVQGELGVYGSPAEHRALEVGCICRGHGHRAQVVLRRAGDRMGAGLVQPDHRECDGEEKGDVVVREQGTPPVVVRGDGELRLAVAGDRVNAGARGTLEAGICSLRDRVKVHQVPEVEGPQERAVARVFGARSPPVRRSGRRVGVSHHEDGRQVHDAGDLLPNARPPSNILCRVCVVLCCAVLCCVVLCCVVLCCVCVVLCCVVLCCVVLCCVVLCCVVLCCLVLRCVVLRCVCVCVCVVLCCVVLCCVVLCCVVLCCVVLCCVVLCCVCVCVCVVLCCVCVVFVFVLCCVVLCCVVLCCVVLCCVVLCCVVLCCVVLCCVVLCCVVLCCAVWCLCGVCVVPSVVVLGCSVLPSYLQVQVQLHKNEKTITIPVGTILMVDGKDQCGPTAASAGCRPDTPSHTQSSLGRY